MTDFETFYREYSSFVGYLARKSGYPDTDEIVQEVMLEVWKSWDKLAQPKEDPHTWFLACLRRTTNHKIWRLRGWGYRDGGYFQYGKAIIDGATTPGEVPDTVLHPSAEDEYLASSLGPVWALVEGLSPLQRAAVKLYYQEDLPTVKIAARLGRSDRSIIVALYKARNRLREALSA